MQDTSGRRERKKRATRAALANAAVDLFAAHGFDETTIADIAERAGVSTRTFFLHFPTKEAVLSGFFDERLELGLRAIAEPVPGEEPEGVLSRAVRVMMAEQPDETAISHEHYRIVIMAPSVQVSLARRRIESQDQIAAALRERFADRLDDVEAAALTAATLSAVQVAATITLLTDGAMESTMHAVSRAVDIALYGRRRDG